MATVEIYTSPMCGYCFAAKRLLKSKAANFSEINVMAQPAKRREMMDRAHGHHTVPQIFIGGKHIGGCDELHMLDRQGKLDTMLAR